MHRRGAPSPRSKESARSLGSRGAGPGPPRLLGPRARHARHGSRGRADLDRVRASGAPEVRQADDDLPDQESLSRLGRDRHAQGEWQDRQRKLPGRSGRSPAPEAVVVHEAVAGTIESPTSPQAVAFDAYLFQQATGARPRCNGCGGLGSGLAGLDARGQDLSHEREDAFLARPHLAQQFGMSVQEEPRRQLRAMPRGCHCRRRGSGRSPSHVVRAVVPCLSGADPDRQAPGVEFGGEQLQLDEVVAMAVRGTDREMGAPSQDVGDEGRQLLVRTHLDEGPHAVLIEALDRLVEPDR